MHCVFNCQEFEKKFREKTQNPWSNRDSFKPVDGKYSIVETEDTEGGGNDTHACMHINIYTCIYIYI